MPNNCDVIVEPTAWTVIVEEEIGTIKKVWGERSTEPLYQATTTMSPSDPAVILVFSELQAAVDWLHGMAYTTDERVFE